MAFLTNILQFFNASLHFSENGTDSPLARCSIVTAATLIHFSSPLARHRPVLCRVNLVRVARLALLFRLQELPVKLLPTGSSSVPTALVFLDVILEGFLVETW